MSEVTGQRSPGKGKAWMKPSYLVLIMSLLIYGGARAYAAYRAAKNHTATFDAARPVLALNSFVGDLDAFYIKQRPLRFPKDLSELDAVIWKPRRQAGRPDPKFTDGNRTYVVDNYEYVYTLSKNPGECGIFAAPVGPRREEENTLFVLVTPQGVSRRWKGAALKDSDLEALPKVGIPTANQLVYLGLVEVREQVKKP
jgi:hypothetical protein